MMKTVKYEKPEMKFVCLDNTENIARECWSGATEVDRKPDNKNYTWKYIGDSNIPDEKEGYANFIVKADNCAAATKDNIEFTYFGGAAENSDALKNVLREGLIKLFDDTSNKGSSWELEASLTPIISSR